MDCHIYIIVSLPDVSKLLEDEKKQLSDWEARLAFTAGFKSTVEVHGNIAQC